MPFVYNTVYGIPADKTNERTELLPVTPASRKRSAQSITVSNVAAPFILSTTPTANNESRLAKIVNYGPEHIKFSCLSAANTTPVSNTNIYDVVPNSMMDVFAFPIDATALSLMTDSSTVLIIEY